MRKKVDCVTLVICIFFSLSLSCETVFARTIAKMNLASPYNVGGFGFEGHQVGLITEPRFQALVEYLRQEENEDTEIEKFLEFLQEGDALLDVGTGDTKLISRIAKANPNKKIIAIDVYDLLYPGYRQAFFDGTLTAQTEEQPNLVVVRADFKQLYPLLLNKSIKEVLFYNPHPAKEGYLRLFILVVSHGLL